MKINANRRSRLWTLILYPESAPKNWKEILTTELNLRFAVSPLHDKDVNPDGSVKKAHWHLLLVFDGKKSFEQISQIAIRLKCAIPQVCNSAKGLVRYFCHLDNPEKYQYSISEIFSAGVDVDDLLKLTQSEKLLYLQRILDFAEEKNIFEYYDLVMILREYDAELFKLSVENTFFLTAILRSKRHKRKENNQNNTSVK